MAIARSRNAGPLSDLIVVGFAPAPSKNSSLDVVMEAKRVPGPIRMVSKVPAAATAPPMVACDESHWAPPLVGHTAHLRHGA